MAGLPKEKIKYANFLAGLTLIGAVIILSLYFINQQIEAVRGRLIVKKNELIAAENREKLISDLTTENNALEKEIRAIENALPNRDNIVNFIKDLENLASTTGVKMSLKFIEKPEKDPQTGNLTLVFNLELEGTSSAIDNFLQATKKLPYFITVYQFNENIDPSGNIKANAKLGVFVNESF